MAGWRKQKQFGNRVRCMMAQLGNNVADLAKLTGASEGYLYRVLRGEQEPTWSLAVAIAEVLNCRVDDLTD